MQVSDFVQEAKNLEQRVLVVKNNVDILTAEIQDLNNKITAIDNMNQTLEKAIVILTQASNTLRDNARQHFEKIVTDALQFISQSDDYEFVVQELVGRAKASYEFYIKSTVNGVECLQKPEDANGGGFVDIISVAAKYAYLEIFSDPKIMSGTLFFDEPGKMISEQMSIKFAEYIKFLGHHYGRQTIMITHNDNLANVADKTIMVSKNNNGISNCSELTPEVNFWDVLNELGGIEDAVNA